MGAGLVGDQVGHDPTAHQLGQEVGGIGAHADRQGAPGGDRLLRASDRLVDVVRGEIEVAGLEPSRDPPAVDLGRQEDAAVHRGRERLRPAHPTQTGGDDQPAGEAAAEVLARRLGEGLVGSLQDPLGADVDPGAGRHLAVHDQALAVQLVEVLPVRPGGHDQRVRDQDPRRVGMGAEDADRLAGLHEQRLVVAERAQGAHDGLEALPVARSLADPAVDDEVLRAARRPRDRGCSSASAGRPPAARSGRRAVGRAVARTSGVLVRHRHVSPMASGPSAVVLGVLGVPVVLVVLGLPPCLRGRRGSAPRAAARERSARRRNHLPWRECQDRSAAPNSSRTMPRNPAAKKGHRREPSQ